MAAIKLLVADDHEVVRAGLKSILTGTDIKIIGEASTGEAALRLAMKHNPDVVLMDIRMPDGDGLTALNRIKLDRPNIPVLMWSAFDNPTYVARAVALGANGYILKSSSREKLLQGIRAAAKGENTWTREELRRVTGALATPRLVVRHRSSVDATRERGAPSTCLGTDQQGNRAGAENQL